MANDLDIQRAIAAGERNLETWELVRNWCRHARIEKMGGTGLIEQQTGLPIGHHAMVCDQASGGGMATYFLADSVLEFHDRHCSLCIKREPVGVPNISKLVDRRDADSRREHARQAELLHRSRIELEERRAVRAELRAVSSVLVSSFLDDLDEFDVARDHASATRLIESARLAPELLTGAVAEHLFVLLESGEQWFAETGLAILRSATVDSRRLAHCAMECIVAGAALRLAAEVAAERVDDIEQRDVREAMLGLAFVACAPRSYEFMSDQDPDNAEPLRRIFARFSAEATKGLDELISDRRSFRVRLGSRAAVVLAPDHPDLLLNLRRTLIARLARADSLIDFERESEMRDVVHDLTLAVVAAFVSDPVGIDDVVMAYFEGGSADGQSRLSGVYQQVMRQALRVGRGAETTNLHDHDVYRVALRRILILAGTSANGDVLQDVIEALRSEPEALSWLAREQMDALLGAAIVIDSKTSTPRSASIVMSPEHPLDALEEENHRWRLRTLCGSFIRWAVHGATVDAVGLAAFIAFLEKGTNLSDTAKAAIIEELPPLLATGEELRAVLPFLYGAMVGESSLVRSAAARCVSETGSRRLAEMPSLVMEAFLLMLSDRYVIVHKSAVTALGRVRLPDEYSRNVRAALNQLIVAYRNEKDHDFLLQCMDAYLTVSKHDQASTTATKVFMAIVSEVPHQRLLRSQHQWLLRRLSHEVGYAELVFALLGEAEMDYEQEKILELVREMPAGTSGQHCKAALNALGHHPSDSVIVGTLLEVFSRDEAWGAALEIASAQVAAIPNTARMRSRKLFADQWRCHAEFEYLLSQGRVEEALAVGQAWDQASSEIERIRKEHETTRPY